jgi:hypothetical protein
MICPKLKDGDAALSQVLLRRFQIVSLAQCDERGIAGEPGQRASVKSA